MRPYEVLETLLNYDDLPSISYDILLSHMPCYENGKFCDGKLILTHYQQREHVHQGTDGFNVFSSKSLTAVLTL